MSSRPKTASTYSASSLKPQSSSRYDNDASEKKHSGERTYTSGGTFRRGASSKKKKCKPVSAIDAAFGSMMGNSSETFTDVKKVAPKISKGFIEMAEVALGNLSQQGSKIKIVVGELMYNNESVPTAILPFEFRTKKAGKVAVVVTIFDNTRLPESTGVVTRVHLLRGSTASDKKERGILRNNVLKKDFSGSTGVNAVRAFATGLVGIVLSSEEFIAMCTELESSEDDGEEEDDAPPSNENKKPSSGMKKSSSSSSSAKASGALNELD